MSTQATFLKEFFMKSLGIFDDFILNQACPKVALNPQGSALRINQSFALNFCVKIFSQNSCNSYSDCQRLFFYKALGGTKY
jgi:hypothetical protein